ncbi:hypothetical protein SH680_002068 [Salmonella enterica]|nr:hypothetical protein [Salmonella enterica]
MRLSAGAWKSGSRPAVCPGGCPAPVTDVPGHRKPQAGHAGDGADKNGDNTPAAGYKIKQQTWKALTEPC